MFINFVIFINVLVVISAVTIFPPRTCGLNEVRAWVNPSLQCQKHCPQLIELPALCVGLVSDCACAAGYVRINVFSRQCILEKYCPAIGDLHALFSSCNADKQPTCSNSSSTAPSTVTLSSTVHISSTTPPTVSPSSTVHTTLPSSGHSGLSSTTTPTVTPSSTVHTTNGESDLPSTIPLTVSSTGYSTQTSTGYTRSRRAARDTTNNNCVPGYVCAEGYVKNLNGKCVRPYNC